MQLIEVNNISKIYKTNGNELFYALQNVSFALPNCGLVAIQGKSGSGKSTLLNLLASFDTPSEGEILFKGRSLNNLFKNKKEEYRNKEIGIVFQHYQLIEEESALFNIMLPSLLLGDSALTSKRKAKYLLEKIDFRKELWNQRCKNLSGGEKQRVALLRALINNPSILLADEPTGALDSKNSIIVMNMLKEESKKRLVILVSHNESLVKEYADRIITISDGKLVEDKKCNTIQSLEQRNRKGKLFPHKDYLDHIASFNLLRRFWKNIISILSLIIGLTSSMLILGFSNGAESAIKRASLSQLDFGSLTLSKEISKSIPGSKMSIVQVLRPSTNECSSVINKNIFTVEPNFDSLISNYSISFGEEVVKGLFLSPIYSFLDESINKNLLISGHFPNHDLLHEVVINKTAFNFLRNKMNSDPLNSVMRLSVQNEFHYYTGNADFLTVTDCFVLDKYVRITGVVDDFPFLSTPTIYYSYLALCEYTESSLLNNLSSYFGYDVSWYSRVSSCMDNEQLSAFSNRVFLKNFHQNREIDILAKTLANPMKINCNSLIKRDSLVDLIRAATVGMSIFLIIAILGTALILGIVSFSSYSEDRKICAIYSCLGMKKKDISLIYVSENILIGIAALIVSFVLIAHLESLANYLISSFFGIDHIVDIPIMSYQSIKFLLPVLLIISTLLICMISTELPISLSKKILLSEELKDE